MRILKRIKRHDVAKIKRLLSRNGFCRFTTVAVKRFKKEFERFSCYVYFKVGKSNVFFLHGQPYSYFYHWYNETWKNERAVEIPIILSIMKTYDGKKILEVGNVLSHYSSIKHDIVDKYDEDSLVINQDVVDFNPNKKYDLIVSISTLEHVGWDEKPRDPTKIPVAFENLKKLLSPEGKIAVTLPIGYNPEMDKLLKQGQIQFTEQYCLMRISRNNKWVETSWANISNAKYGYPFRWANGLVIGIIENF